MPGGPTSGQTSLTIGSAAGAGTHWRSHSGQCNASGGAACTSAGTAPTLPLSGGRAPEGTSLWPALLPTPKLDSLQSGLIAWTRSGRSQESCNPHDSTDRIDRALSLAFDRLWRDRPCSTANPETGDEDHPQLLCTVDGYISRYFHRVATLSRESVYQAHQRKILHRMKDDVICGDRCGKLQELEERISKAELDDHGLQSEMAELLRIVAAGDQAASGSDTSLSRSSPCCCRCPVTLASTLASGSPALGVTTTARSPVAQSGALPSCSQCFTQ